MPVIQITLLKGRTLEQKRKIAARITDAVAEEARTPREGIVVTFNEVEREDYAHGGILVCDQKPKS